MGAGDDGDEGCGWTRKGKKCQAGEGVERKFMKASKILRGKCQTYTGGGKEGEDRT